MLCERKGKHRYRHKSYVHLSPLVPEGVTVVHAHVSTIRSFGWACNICTSHLVLVKTMNDLWLGSIGCSLCPGQVIHYDCHKQTKVRKQV